MKNNPKHIAACLLRPYAICETHGSCYGDLSFCHPEPGSCHNQLAPFILTRRGEHQQNTFCNQKQNDTKAAVTLSGVEASAVKINNRKSR